MTNKNDLIKILYVDDEVINLELFNMAYQYNYNVLIADSGDKGIEIAEKDKDIQFIISDMKMPLMNGLEFIKRVKKIRQELPCIILSGYQKDEEINQALKSGILIDYVMKPFNKNQLKELIQKNLNKK
jgi:two-component system, response regulator, stage 0 sporulation protein F